MKVQVILFICPNKDFFHGDSKDEHVDYLLIPNHVLVTKWAEPDGAKPYASTKIREEPMGYILIGDPSDAEQSAIIGAFPHSDVLRYPRVCGSCRRKGVRG